ncbi:MAG: PstS family phosphate ABC transporter substrate-binding protein, partial [Planctomycetota bacterium]
RTSGVKLVPLSNKDGEPALDGSYQNVVSGKYPLSRLLYIYVAKKLGEPLPVMTLEFLCYALLKEGQKVVVKDGYLPLPAKVAEEQLKLLE